MIVCFLKARWTATLIGAGSVFAHSHTGVISQCTFVDIITGVAIRVQSKPEAASTPVTSIGVDTMVLAMVRLVALIHIHTMAHRGHGVSRQTVITLVRTNRIHTPIRIWTHGTLLAALVNVPTLACLVHHKTTLTNTIIVALKIDTTLIEATLCSAHCTLVDIDTFFHLEKREHKRYSLRI